MWGMKYAVYWVKAKRDARLNNNLIYTYKYLHSYGKLVEQAVISTCSIDTCLSAILMRIASESSIT